MEMARAREREKGRIWCLRLVKLSLIFGLICDDRLNLLSPPTNKPLELSVDGRWHRKREQRPIEMMDDGSFPILQHIVQPRRRECRHTAHHRYNIARSMDIISIQISIYLSFVFQIRANCLCIYFFSLLFVRRVSNKISGGFHAVLFVVYADPRV